ncbi:hypothetical protein J6590_005846 [Homalodisca vitripennis]|nr:hypothetical protein J6590_005846 [Homalodisca vitripennis]
MTSRLKLRDVSFTIPLTLLQFTGVLSAKGRGVRNKGLRFSQIGLRFCLDLRHSLIRACVQQRYTLQPSAVVSSLV